MEKKRNIPELLAPAGSPLALRAAIEGGADAIYVGGVEFNARINAKNFTPEELKEGIALAHSYGVKVYIAANTLIFDREREAYLRAAERAYLFGADALIVADLGMARELKKRIPIEIHASTQLSGHNADAAKILAQAGFSRMVCAREMSGDDLREFCRNSPIEAEVFVHGALCVSTSGQCLFSSIVGGRSGNRGECAQPCRLPYAFGKKQSYPLSLRDLSLAEHIVELCDMGVSSFKIEGRMKSPEYVRDVTRIWRELLDQRRNATDKDMAELARIFSRGGFTDGYYTGKIDTRMLGVRSADDKKQSQRLPDFDKITRRIGIAFSASITEGKPISLTATTAERSVTVCGAIPLTAINAPLTHEQVEKNLSRLGNTPYELSSFELELGEGLMLPISALNSLRREAVKALEERDGIDENAVKHIPLEASGAQRANGRTAIFYDVQAIPSEAWDFFDVIYVPLEKLPERADQRLGVMLPEVIFDSQYKEVEGLLSAARDNGIKKALVCNVGHVELAKKYGFELRGDMRLNVTNSSSLAELERMGMEDVILSPELSLAQIRDIGGRSRVIVWGRLPLMITEKCVGKELGGCQRCSKGQTVLTDRRGVDFPVMMRFGHRSLIVNSVPTYMADRRAEILRAGVTAEHFIFTTESKSEVSDVIRAYKKGSEPVSGDIKRIR